MNDDNILTRNSLSSDEVRKIEEFRKAKQTAILAILFSDIVNSTYATEKLGEQAYSKLRHLHDELFRKIMCRDNAGIIIKEIGDSFLCVFAEPSTAVLRAVEFQQAINLNKAHLTTQHYTLTVRIGIHVGQVAVENSLALDIFGRHVNRTARIEAIANGGQILTSLSVWENAVGWIKDSNQDKIGWRSHGKTRLKGVEEKVEIFEFFSKEYPKPTHPVFIRKRKQNQSLFIILGFVLLAGSYFILKDIVKEAPEPPSGRKAYYVQFDFSEISKQIKSGATKMPFDTIEIADRLLAQAISAVSPDSVVTEVDLIKSFSRRGELYQRHSTPYNYNINDNQEDHRYFRNTLEFAGVMLIAVSPLSKVENDSIVFSYKIVLYPDATTSHERSTQNTNLKYLEKYFLSSLKSSFDEIRLRFIQGHVLTCDNNVIIFKLTKDAKLRTGASIRMDRNYSGKGGLYERLNYLQMKIDYFRSNNSDSVELKDTYLEYDRIKKMIPNTDSIDNNAYGLNLRARVTELYDSTGKATWQVNGKFLLERPKAGDLIYITN